MKLYLLIVINIIFMPCNQSTQKERSYEKIISTKTERVISDTLKINNVMKLNKAEIINKYGAPHFYEQFILDGL